MSYLTYPSRGPSLSMQDAGSSRLGLLFDLCQRNGDCAAREELVVHFLPLARKLARRYSRSSEPYEDLVQVASLALMKAIDRFDPGCGRDFQAFAIPTILGELKRYFRDSTWAVHVPRSAQERALTIDTACTVLTDRHGRAPSVNEIATHLGLTHEEVIDGLCAAEAYAAQSLEAPLGSEDDGDFKVGDSLGVEDERYELIDDKLAVADAMRSLPPRERLILHLRFVKEMTQTEIAARLGTSQMHVSRVLRRSLAQLREHAGAEG
jgi:RNA polymerase sigma-B factor